MRSLPRTPRWAEVLQNIEAALAQAVAETSQREQALQATAADASNAAVWRQSLDRLEQRLQQMQALVDRATAEVRAIDQTLAESEGVLAAGRITAQAARQKLAAAPFRAV